MITISKAVREILLNSEAARLAYQGGYLNFSAYAATIQRDVERRTKKSVALSTIVVTLSRLRRDVKGATQLLPKVNVEQISVTSSLMEITFEKSPLNRRKFQTLQQSQEFSEAEFFTVTQGVGEFSLIMPMKLKTRALSYFKGQSATLQLENLAAITVRFSPNYIQIPNTTYALLRPLAIAQVNIVEIVSTFTELTFVISQKDLTKAFTLLNQFLDN